MKQFLKIAALILLGYILGVSNYEAGKLENTGARPQENNPPQQQTQYPAQVPYTLSPSPQYTSNYDTSYSNNYIYDPTKVYIDPHRFFGQHFGIPVVVHGSAPPPPPIYTTPIYDADMLSYLYMKDPLLFSFYRGLYGLATLDANVIYNAHKTAYARGQAFTPPHEYAHYILREKLGARPDLLGAMGVIYMVAMDYEGAKADMWVWRQHPHWTPFQLFLYRDFYTYPAMRRWYSEKERPIPLPP